MCHPRLTTNVFPLQQVCSARQPLQSSVPNAPNLHNTCTIYQRRLLDQLQLPLTSPLHYTVRGRPPTTCDARMSLYFALRVFLVPLLRCHLRNSFNGQHRRQHNFCQQYRSLGWRWGWECCCDAQKYTCRREQSKYPYYIIP